MLRIHKCAAAPGLAVALIVLAPLRRGERTAIVESSAKYDVAAWLEEVARSPFTFRAGGSSDWGWWLRISVYVPGRCSHPPGRSCLDENPSHRCHRLRRRPSLAA